jgi:hypothetical protein
MFQTFNDLQMLGFELFFGQEIILVGIQFLDGEFLLLNFTK